MLPSLLARNGGSDWGGVLEIVAISPILLVA